MKKLVSITLFLLSLLFVFPETSLRADDELRIGLIGLDTSHVVAFTRVLNNPEHPDHVPGGRVVAAYKGGSPDIESSWSRLEGFTETLVDDFEVEIFDTIEELCQNVDAVMLTSVDGRPHLEQARPVFEAGLPLFIDKPVAGSLADALEIFRLADESGTPVFSSSSLRYYQSLRDLLDTDVGEVRGALSTGPARIEPTHPDLFWYGIHAVESLYTVMGKGCESVVRTHTEDTDVVTGVWSGGRVGTVRGIRNARAPFRVTLYGTGGVADQQGGGGYPPLLAEIIRFFQTGNPPVAPEETIELFAFMEAADESKRRGGKPVKVQEVIEIAEEKNARLPRGRPEEVGMNGGALADGIETAIRSAIEEKILPGGAVIVGREGKVVYERAFGRHTYDDGAPDARLSTIYDLASLTKVIGTTTACMILHDRGLIELDEPVATYLPEFPHSQPTVADLLRHQGGFPSWRPFFRNAESAEEVMEAIYSIELENPPGEETVYSDIGMIVLARLVEAVSGEPLDVFLEKNVFSSLGMEDTSFNPAEVVWPRIAPTEIDDSFRDGLVHGVVHDENAYALGGVAGHAGLFSTVSDVALFAQMLANGGELAGKRIVESDTISQFVRRPEEGRRGLGWGLQREGRTGGDGQFSSAAFGHTGFTGTSLWIDPVHDVFIVFLSNRVHPTRERGGIGGVRAEVYRAVIGSLPSEN